MDIAVTALIGDLRVIPPVIPIVAGDGVDSNDVPVVETHSLLPEAAEDVTDITGDTYGPLKVTCERIVPNDEFRQDPTRTVIPFFCVDAVCEVPYGSYPGNMPYEYFSDEKHLRHWLDVEKDMPAYQEFLTKYIYGVRDFSDYLQLCGGLPRLQQSSHR